MTPQTKAMYQEVVNGLQADLEALKKSFKAAGKELPVNEKIGLTHQMEQLAGRIDEISSRYLSE